MFTTAAFATVLLASSVVSARPPVVLVSVAADGEAANGPSLDPSVSVDGRYVAFESYADDLAGNLGPLPDVFVRDVVAGTTELVSVDAHGGGASGGSYSPSISADGRYVAFESAARDLVRGDAPDALDVFVRDREAGTTVLVSVGHDGAPADDHSYGSVISAGGRYVAFKSDATNLVAGDGGESDFYPSEVYVRDLVAGTTTRVSADEPGVDDYSWDPSMSANGRYVGYLHVVFTPQARGEAVVHDRLTGTSVTIADAFHMSLSGTGRYLAFSSQRDDLVPGDANGDVDVFVRDLATGSTTRASVDVAGGDAAGPSELSSISDDGRFVAFQTRARDVVPGGGNGKYQVVIRDLAAGTTTLASRGSDGEPGRGDSEDPDLAGDGRHVAFQSNALGLVAGHVNDETDVYLATPGRQ
ncbi:MAG TPA: hypothetical protein VGB14_04800 [Acidimicrobiales bacterium]|jgi:Tol biopolymer transport system component